MIMEMAREMKVYFNLLHWDFQQRIVEPAKLFAKLKSDIWENERIADLSRTVLPEQLECAWRVSKSGHQKESVEILYGIFERGTFSL